MLKNTNNYIKTLIVITSLAFAGGVFAQVSNPVSDLTLTQQQLSGTLTGGLAGYDINLVLVGVNEANNTPYQTLFSFVSGQQAASNFSFNIPDNNTVLSNGLRVVTQNDSYLFNQINITVTDTATSVESGVLQSFNIVNILQGDIDSGISVDFPGWENLPAEEAFAQIPNSGGKYYPIVKSNRTVNGSISTTRSPANATLYLMIEDRNSTSFDNVKLLHTIDSNGSANFNIDFPGSYYTSGTLPVSAQLDPGGSYAVFLSDLYIPNTAPGDVYYNVVDVGSSDSTYEVLPQVPGGTVSNDPTDPVDPNNPSSDNNGNTIDPNSGNGNVTPIYTQQQLDIISGGIAPDCGYQLSDGGRICGFADVIVLIQRVIEYIFILVVPITAIVFVYAGYLYLTSGGSAQKREAAKNAMIKVLIGIVVVMSAWLLVTLVVRTLGASEETTQFLDI